MARTRSVAEKYIADVLAGRILTSKLVRLAIERHVKDLKEGKSRGLKFSRQEGQRVIDFFPLFACGTQDEYYGMPLILEPAWQALLWILYGWQRQTEKGWIRRFKFAYSEMGRGNLKSLVLSGLCLYELIGRGVKGAQVYAAATDKKTAKLVFNTAVTMVLENAFLREKIQAGTENMNVPETRSKFEPCAAEDSNLMGLRPSFVCLDELHVHKSVGVWDAFASAMDKCTDPLLFAITNSGYDRNSVCFKKREYSEKVVMGIIPDDTWFAWICGVDDNGQGDFNWEDEKNWIKANPLLGTAVSIEKLRIAAAQAKEDPSALNAFLRFRLCIWTTNFSHWMPMDKWEVCRFEIDAEKLRGRRCWGALDLSTTTDIAAFVLLFEPTEDDPYWRVLPFFFLPKDNIPFRCRRDRVPYDQWERAGLFQLTEGNVIDYRFIRSKINELGGMYDIRQICFDRWNATEIVTQLGEEDGFEMLKVGQGFATMSAPTKRLLELVLCGELAHGGNPVLRWMASNVIVQMDPAGNIKPDKSKSREKIDGIVALCMALFGAMAAGGVPYTDPEIGYV